jgi:NAD(P)-dependent dehydrogenase (short-subunit alcohol dehydrogenase family)
MDLFDLSDRVAIVTGGGGGLGRDLAIALAEAGAGIVVAGRTESALAETCRQIADRGGRASAIALDVTKPADVARAFDRLVNREGRLDILVNAAGGQLRQPALEITEDGWDRLMAVNLKGVFFCCQAAARHMQGAGRGRIISLSSLTAEIGLPKLAAYGATKGGVNQLTRALAVEWAALGITVNAIGPGRIRTAMTEEVFSNPATAESFLSRIPMRRPGEPRDLAGAVVFLASDASSYMTGQILYIDGGWLASGGHAAG